jgi:hypothetical protein
VRRVREGWSTTVDDGEWSEWSEGKGRERGSEQVDLFLITSRNAKHQVLERVVLPLDATSFDSRALCNLSLFDVLRSTVAPRLAGRQGGGKDMSTFSCRRRRRRRRFVNKGSGLRGVRGRMNAVRRSFLLKRASSSHREKPLPPLVNVERTPPDRQSMRKRCTIVSGAIG